MVIAVSTFEVVVIVAILVVGLLLAGGGLGAFGRAAESHSPHGDKLSSDRAEFRRPPDEGGLL